MQRPRDVRPLSAVLCLALLLLANAAAAKDHGLRTPGGRDIYDSDETFGGATEIAQATRFIVIEVATGLAPEGQIAVSLGYLAGQLEFYVGLGLQLDPSQQIALSSRYWFDFGGFEPFVALGYVNQDHSLLGMTTHHLFSEVGYKWRWAKTYHFTLGLGARYIAAIRLREGSTLLGSDVDPELRDEQIDDVFPLMPTLALRFSRAF